MPAPRKRKAAGKPRRRHNPAAGQIRPYGGFMDALAGLIDGVADNVAAWANEVLTAEMQAQQPAHQPRAGRPGQTRTQTPPRTPPQAPSPMPGFTVLECAYGLLGVPTTSNREECRKAYMRIIGECAPDRGGDTARAALVNSAWETIRVANGWRK